MHSRGYLVQEFQEIREIKTSVIVLMKVIRFWFPLSMFIIITKIMLISLYEIFVPNGCFTLDCDGSHE